MISYEFLQKKKQKKKSNGWIGTTSIVTSKKKNENQFLRSDREEMDTFVRINMRRIEQHIHDLYKISHIFFFFKNFRLEKTHLPLSSTAVAASRSSSLAHSNRSIWNHDNHSFLASAYSD